MSAAARYSAAAVMGGTIVSRIRSPIAVKASASGLGPSPFVCAAR